MSRILMMLLVSAACGTALAQIPSTGSGPAYPTRAARLIVPWTPGGTADLLARLTSQTFTESFGQWFVVDHL